MILDNPAYAALTGPQAALAEVVGAARRYPGDISPFLAMPDQPTQDDWADAARLIGPTGEGWMMRRPVPVPTDGWQVIRSFGGVQLVDAGVRAEEDPEAVPLTAADVPEMADLVKRTEPGPFLPRTRELGSYVGIRRHGALIAMAGERMRPTGWTEISAVCTDPAYRGSGLASRLVRHVTAGIRARGDQAFLHTGADNVNAIRLYEKLGFALRTEVTITGVRVMFTAESGA